jgi:phage terminase large subunit-like protein
MPLAIEQYPAKERLIMLLAEKARRAKGRKINELYPDKGPLRRELYTKHIGFLEAGRTEMVRAVIAANRVGKTEGMGGYELTCHLTGQYPAWWKGRRFTNAVRAWCAGDTGKTTRDILQEKLLGPISAMGTGLIPAEYIDFKSIKAKAGVADAIETVSVRHVSGRMSRLVFKSFDQGRAAFQGTEQDVILLDEEGGEDAIDIFSECVTRVMTTKGIVMLTFTPLQGVTPLIKHIRESRIWCLNVTWADVPHLDEATKREILKLTPRYLHDAKSKGVPLLGSGVIFPVSEESITMKAFPIPAHFRRIGGLDFGIDHPSAAVELVYDGDADRVIVTRSTRMKDATPLRFAAELKPWGVAKFASGEVQWLPWAWPEDGLQRDKGSGVQLAEQYRAQGMLLLDDYAQWHDGSVGVEAGLLDMLDRMETNRWKVFDTCIEWLEEFRTYHRDKGKIVKLDDDVLSASRYAHMMLRFAEARPSTSRTNRTTFTTVGDKKLGY